MHSVQYLRYHPKVHFSTGVIIQPRYGHKNMQIRTKARRLELGAPRDKKKNGLDDLPIMTPTSSSAS